MNATDGPAARGALSGSRWTGVDVARCLALIGMMSVHVLSSPFTSGDLVVSGAADRLFVLASGRAAPLFAVLAGVGLALAHGGRTPPPWSRVPALGAGLLVRGAAVGLIGLALAIESDLVAVVLAYYGLLFWLAIPLLPLRPRTLLALAAGWVLVLPWVSHLVRADRPEGPGPQAVLADLAHPVELATTLLLTGYYPALPWLAYLMVGMAIGRCDLTRRTTVAILTLAGAGLALIAPAVSRMLLATDGAVAALPPGLTTSGELQQSFYGTTPADSLWWLAIDAPHSTTPLDLVGTIGTSLLVLGLCLLVVPPGRHGKVAAALTPLAAAGSMTLTLYTLHVMALIAGWGLGPFGDGGEGALAEPTLLTLHVAAAIIVATLWRTAFRRGPIEAVIAAVSGAVVRAASPGGR